MADPMIPGGAVGAAVNDPAAIAARRAAANQAAADAEMAAIKDKGFVAFVRDTLVKSLEEKMREKAMAALGIDPKSLDKMPAAVRREVELRIKQAIQQMMLEEMNKATADQGKPGPSTVNASSSSDQAAQKPQAEAKASPPDGRSADGQSATGQKKPGGISCPVIPILAWPGGPSILG